ncbi:PadR family transcriptional regulator [Prescottella defluvii]|nr:PadR family transcriptional regulator [Prescottella defluvii]
MTVLPRSATPLGISVLALSFERPMHPYEMCQLLVARRKDRIVKVRPGSLYHAVERLERDGLVEVVGTDRQGNRPERTTYEITVAGRRAVRERVAEIVAAPVPSTPSSHSGSRSYTTSSPTRPSACSSVGSRLSSPTSPNSTICSRSHGAERSRNCSRSRSRTSGR